MFAPQGKGEHAHMSYAENAHVSVVSVATVGE